MGLPLARLVAVCLVLALARASELQRGKGLGDLGKRLDRAPEGGEARKPRAVSKGCLV